MPRNVISKLKKNKNLNLKYTITEGTLSNENKKCVLPFALVFEENGVYFLETFLKEGFFEDGDFSVSFNLNGITEKGFEIEIEDLTFTLFKHKTYKAKFMCRNYVKLTEKEENTLQEDSASKEHAILFIEIEGFNIKFADLTNTKNHRYYGKIDEFNVNFDHTSCALYIQIEGYEENYFHLIFSKSKINNTIQIDFTKTDGYGLLTFDHYKVFKKQFLGFLSLLNGGNISVRRELTGDFYKVDGSDSHIVYNYSFPENLNTHTSDYIPINKHHSYSSSIFRQTFMNCFDYFYHNDLKLELTSIVTAINTAHSTSGIHQAYSILINALEKLSSNYQKSNSIFEEGLIDDEIWERTVKESIMKVLDSNKSAINSTNKNAYGIFKSKIGELNRRKNSTVEKMYALFEFGCIPINENVKNLATKERHSAVHNGVFGENSTEMIVNYHKLDHILRDLILNIIDYRSYRESVFEYATLKEKKEAYPKKEPKEVLYICSQPLRR